MQTHKNRFGPSLQQILWTCQTLDRNVKSNTVLYNNLPVAEKRIQLMRLQAEVDSLKEELADFISGREISMPELDLIVRARLRLFEVIKFINLHYHNLRYL